MHTLINAFPLYQFLKFCNESRLDKKVLDCGAGGSLPPLSLFREFGYATYGIEISQEQVDKSQRFCKEHDIDLHIGLGDMCDMRFSDDSFSFLYSYNTSVHMRKVEFKKAMGEFCRVLKPGGLCFVNFLGMGCSTAGEGEELAPGEFLQRSDGEETLFSHYREEEAEAMAKAFDFVFKQERKAVRFADSEPTRSHFLDYILKKR